jgi:hypothetical protein
MIHYFLSDKILKIQTIKDGKPVSLQYSKLNLITKVKFCSI